jgi:hypothetical protein
MSIAKSDFKVGDRVSHPNLGEGDILDLYPYGEELFAVISFEKWGQKKIALGYADLTIVEPPEEEEEPEDRGGARGKKGKKAARAKTKVKAKAKPKPKPKAKSKKKAKAKTAKKTKKKAKKKS